MKVNEVNESEFDKLLLNNNIVLVDFNATWCGPCRMLKPVIEKFSENTNVFVCSVDVDKNELLARKYQIYSIPCVILFQNGVEIKRNVGYMSLDELKKFVGE